MAENRRIKKIICGVLWGLLLLPVSVPAAGGSGGNAALDHIVSVNIPYDLFLSLAEYDALSKAEERGRAVDAKMIPVLGRIIDVLEGELRRFRSLSGTELPAEEISGRVQKMEGLIEDFRIEEMIRRKEQELQKLLEKQKSLIERE